MGSSKFELNLFHRVVILDKKLCFILSFYTQFTAFLRVPAIGGGARRAGGPYPPNKNLGEPPPPHVLVPKITFKDAFRNTGDLGIFRGDIFCPQTTHELPKKHHEAGPHEQLPTA